MTLKDYADKINRLVRHYPEALVVFSKDAEGNAYELVVYDPTEGHFDGMEFVDISNIDRDGSVSINAVCIN